MRHHRDQLSHQTEQPPQQTIREGRGVPGCGNLPRIRWRPGRVGVEGNEEADSLAEEASRSGNQLTATEPAEKSTLGVLRAATTQQAARRATSLLKGPIVCCLRIEDSENYYRKA